MDIKSEREVRHFALPVRLFTNSKCSKFERIYGLASFNRVIYYHVPRYILERTPRCIVVCSKQRVRLLLGELHNLILFRVAAAANISLRDCSRELTRLTRKISGSDELRRGATRKTWH